MVAAFVHVDVAVAYVFDAHFVHPDFEGAVFALAFEIFIGDVEVGVAVGVDVGDVGCEFVAVVGVVVGGDGAEFFGGEAQVAQLGSVGNHGGHFAEEVEGGEGVEGGFLGDVVYDHDVFDAVAKDGIGKSVVGADVVLAVAFGDDEGVVFGLR